MTEVRTYEEWFTLIALHNPFKKDASPLISSYIRLHIEDLRKIFIWDLIRFEWILDFQVGKGYFSYGLITG